jgi:hypothetical protein
MIPHGIMAAIFIPRTRRLKEMNSNDTANPKDKIGRTKPPLGLFPVSAILQGAMALFAGKTKYGRSNWRATPVYASVYFEAGLRHFYKWWEGEDHDPEDGTPHLGNLLACAAILIDAKVCGTLIDDRQFNGKGVISNFNSMNHLVPKLEEQYADKKPKHYTIADTVTIAVEGTGDLRSAVVSEAGMLGETIRFPDGDIPFSGGKA